MSELEAWIARLYRHPELLAMGHNQVADDLNLGLGWIYYGLARLLQPSRVVVIGSWRGFVPLLLGRACQDNRRRGRVTFIDPGLVDDFWHDAAAVARWFAAFDVHNVEHHLATTQQFVAGPASAALDPIGLLFIDGFHSAEQARFDYEAFASRLAPRAQVLFHDSLVERRSRIYGEQHAYTVDVRRYLEVLARDPTLELYSLPFGTGLTLLRKRGGAADEPLLEGVEARP